MTGVFVVAILRWKVRLDYMMKYDFEQFRKYLLIINIPFLRGIEESFLFYFYSKVFGVFSRM